MILQSLTELFERIQAEEDNPYGVPTPGYSVQNITFRIILNPDGSLADIQDARKPKPETTKSGQTKIKLVPNQTLLPGEGKPPGSGINPCTLWDNTAYLLGYKKPDKDPAKTAKEAARALETLAATKAHYITLTAGQSHPTLIAIRDFYEKHWTAERAAEWTTQLDDFAATGFGVFRVLPGHKDAHEEREIKDWLATLQPAAKTTTEPTGFCLVTGKELPIARLHDPAIKGVNGAAPGGAKLASFNLNPFESYAKEQSYNAPVSESAVFAYCNALNALLSGPQSYRHRVTIGDVTAIFWTEKESKTESLFAQFLNGDINPEKETVTTEDETQHRQLQAFLNILRQGGGASIAELEDDPDTKFYLLGLSGNVTRLVVRFWQVSTIGQMLGNLRDHFQNLSLARKKDPHPFWEPEFPSAQRLLDQTARERKAIAPLLGGQLMQSILHRTPYPMTLLQGVMNRLRANDPVDYLKAAILKAYLNRNHLIKPTDKQMTAAIDPTRKEPAYHLGRLFAVYETAQKHAHDWKLERTIRETMYSSASATPLSVFGRLERLHHHHTAKKSHPYGSSDSYVDIVSEIEQHFKGGSTPYPATLDLIGQSLFAVGYYHQLQYFRNLSDSKKTDPKEPAIA